MTFADLKVGMKVRVAGVTSHDDFMCRLMEMGLIPGSEFRVTKVAPLGDPVEIELRGFRLCVRRFDARALHLEPAEQIA